jgi:hypothetical protein
VEKDIKLVAITREVVTIVFGRKLFLPMTESPSIVFRSFKVQIIKSRATKHSMGDVSRIVMQNITLAAFIK